MQQHQAIPAPSQPDPARAAGLFARGSLAREILAALIAKLLALLLLWLLFFSPAQRMAVTDTSFFDHLTAGGAAGGASHPSRPGAAGHGG